MENKFEKSLLMSKVNNVEKDLNLFGELLRKSRINIGKSVKKISLELNTNDSQVDRWERENFFPKEDMLPEICKVYATKLAGIEFEELVRTFNVSKAAREVFKNAKKNPKPKKFKEE